MKKIITIISALLISVMFLYPLKVYAADSGVTLDGYFDDWIDKPSQSVYDSPKIVHTVKWYSDNQNLYLYVKMSTKGKKSIGNYNIKYSSNNGSQGHIRVNVGKGTTGTGRISVYLGNSLISTDGYVVHGSDRDGSDQSEFRIPLSTFEKDNKNEMMTLKLNFQNLGKQSIEFQVGSTYPYVGITICILCTASGFFIYRRKRKTE